MGGRKNAGERSRSLGRSGGSLGASRDANWRRAAESSPLLRRLRSTLHPRGTRVGRTIERSDFWSRSGHLERRVHRDASFPLAPPPPPRPFFVCFVISRLCTLCAAHFICPWPKAPENGMTGPRVEHRDSAPVGSSLSGRRDSPSLSDGGAEA